MSQAPPNAKQTNHRRTPPHAHKSIAGTQASVSCDITYLAMSPRARRKTRTARALAPPMPAAGQEVRRRPRGPAYAGRPHNERARVLAVQVSAIVFHMAFFRCVSAAIDGQWRARRIRIGAERGGGTRSRNLRAISR